jgi:methionine-rich copper-binding protein CopC
LGGNQPDPGGSVHSENGSHGLGAEAALSGRAFDQGEFLFVPISGRTRRAMLAGVLAILLSPGPVEAHAILEASTPNAGDSVHSGAIAVTLRFNSRIDRGRSRLTLTGPAQQRATPPIDPDGPPDIMTTTLSLTPGAYVLRWQVLAIDGHITRGDVPFTVTEP